MVSRSMNRILCAEDSRECDQDTKSSSGGMVTDTACFWDRIFEKDWFESEMECIVSMSDAVVVSSSLVAVPMGDSGMGKVVAVVILAFETCRPSLLVVVVVLLW